MSFVNLLIHLANVSYLIGSGFKKIILLRVFFVIGCSLEAIYLILISPKDLWAGISWSILIMVLNIIMIAIYYFDKGTLRLKDDERFLFQNVFSKMDKVNFKKLLNAGNWLGMPKGDILIYEKQSTDYLMLLFQGNVEIVVGDKQVAILYPGSFVGEMSFLTGDLTTAMAKAISDVKLYAWKKTDLIKLLAKNQELEKEMRYVFSSDLISKLTSKNKQ
ncbi:MAG: cyclic nucleotide-binding domain-containing protein [Ignavibacteriae bacterium]|nr:cyclic nucleotide-binding domain-containing protein [Ignavibacteriota bacterium]